MRGFSLAETLVALLILSIISIYSIPKMIINTRTSASEVEAKEVAGFLTSAYQQHKIQTGVSSLTKGEDLIPYLNYVKIMTLGELVDAMEGSASSNNCDNGSKCIKLHSGGVLYFSSFEFGGTTATNAIKMQYDPDGVYSGLSTGPSKAIRLYLYYNGRIATKGTIAPSTCDANGCDNPSTSQDPVWWSGW